MNSADYNHVSHGINKDKVIKCSLAWSYIRHQTKIIILKFYLPTKIYLAKKKMFTCMQLFIITNTKDANNT